MELFSFEFLRKRKYSLGQGVILGSVFAVSLTTLLGVLWAVVT